MAEKIRRRTDRFHKQRQRKRLGIIRRQSQKRRIGERKTDWDPWQTQQRRCVVEHSITDLGPLKQKRCKSEHTHIGPSRQTHTNVSLFGEHGYRIWANTNRHRKDAENQ